MSNRTRTLIIGATLAAMHLAGMTAVAHAQANDEPVMQPPTERQVGEAWRHRQAASPEQTAADAALQRQLARERFAIPNATPAQTPAPVPPRTKRTTQLAPCRARGAVSGAGGSGGWAGHGGRPARQSPDSGRAGDLTAVTVTLDGAAAPTGSPIAYRRWIGAYFAGGHGIASVRCSGRAVERIPSPLTVASDLGKRRSAQRLALDT